jgi:hypothetical protein
MKVVSSSMFHTMIFPHNGKIIIIDQLTHYEPNHFANIDKILPLVIDMDPVIFKDPSFLGAYHGEPPLQHPSSQVCVVSSNGTDIGDNTPPVEAPLHIEIPPVE